MIKPFTINCLPSFVLTQGCGGNKTGIEVPQMIKEFENIEKIYFILKTLSMLEA